MTEIDQTATIGAAEVIRDLVRLKLFIADPGNDATTHDEASSALRKGLEAANKLQAGFPFLNVKFLEELVATHSAHLGDTEDLIIVDELLEDLIDGLVPDRPE